jgi:threonyl-tRNA synthetase
MVDSSDLSNLRHSCAHLLAAAVTTLWPGTLPTLGPAIDDGFYYDFDLGDTKISENDFKTIEKEMERIVKQWSSFERTEVSVNEARKMFAQNTYKLELIDELKQPLTIYKSGDFTDLCRGGHVEEPNKSLKHFKLMSVAGAYWRGSENNKMLTRIYGTAFPTKKELDDYLTMLAEAKKRDHKKIGKELGLFTFSDLVGQGLPLWTPKGTLVRDLLNDFVWELRKSRGYERVCIPHIAKRELYEKSGHWAKFSNELFKIKTREGHDFVMKPMNCPHHTQIFNSAPRSYKDMPQRYAETTMVYRDEQSGELSGLSRVRSVTQDDAHVFCRKSQMKEEFIRIWDIVQSFYGVFGFASIQDRS